MTVCLFLNHCSIPTKSTNSICTECSNLLLDYYVCIHVPGAETTSPVPKPTDNGHFPTQSGIAKDCDKYHKIVTGDQCYAIESNNQITHEQFRNWNPAVDASTFHIPIALFPLT